jgi:hypothetical protein
MKVTELVIKKRASYEEFAGELVGTVTIVGDLGKQEIVISPKAVSQIFVVIATDVQRTAKVNATLVEHAIEDAIHGPLLTDSAEVLALS